MGVPSMPELLIILVIILLLFGAKKIPDLASGLGKGIKNFKKSMDSDEEVKTTSTDKIEEKEKPSEPVKTEEKKEA